MNLVLAIYVILPVSLTIAGVPPLMRPRPGSDVSRCDLEDRKASIQCVMQCIQDPCCLAVTITAAQCEMGYIPADASNMDLIKEPHATPSGDCSCTLETEASEGGQPFSHKELYEAKRSPITKLIASVHDKGDERIYNMGLELADGSRSDGIDAFTNLVECVLGPGERVTSARVHLDFVAAHDRFFPIGVEFVTIQKTCPLFGKTGSKVVQLYGHRLLYVGGRNAALLDVLYLTFDYGCNVQ